MWPFTTFNGESYHTISVLQGQVAQLSSVLRDLEREVAKLRDEVAVLRTMVR